MKKITKKIMQYIMLFGMIFSSFQTPIQVFADEIAKNDVEPNKGDIKLGVNGEISETGSVSTTAVSNDGNVEVKKTVSAVDAANGKFHVNFEIKGKESTEELPVYVVIVFDRSGSMCKSMDCSKDTKWTNAIDGAQTFTETLLSSLPGSKIALVTFASSASQERGFEHASLPKSSFGSPNGGTNLHDGLIEANDYLTNGIPQADKEKALKYIVVMSDGQPTNYVTSQGGTGGEGNSTNRNTLEKTLSEANTIKDKGISIYSIGYSLPTGNVYNGNYTVGGNTYYNQKLTARNILELVASSSSQYFGADNESQIVSTFRNLAISIISPGKNATLKDNIGDNFKIVDNENYGGTYQSPVISKITNDTLTYEFDIEIDQDSSDGWYQTNKGFNLVYTNSAGNEETITGDEDPYVYWKQKTYNYVVNYYKDSITDTNKIASDTRAAVKDTVIDEENVQKDKYLATAGTGYEFNSVSPESITISNDGTVKTINVLYTLKKFDYRVNYYYDNTLDSSLTEEDVTYGTNVDPSDYYLAASDIREGYKLDETKTDEDTIVIDDVNKEINIYYIKDNFEYSVNYYFNTEINETLSLKEQFEEFGKVIKAEDNHLSDTTLNSNGYGDYFLDPTMSASNYGQITIGTDLDRNKLNIYYINTIAGNEKIVKSTTNNTITSSNDVVNYTVNYQADITNVRKDETVVVTIVDTLPYEIDVTKSTLNDGVYDATTKTITWTITKNITEFTKEYKVNETINYSVVYKDFANISASDSNALENGVYGRVKVSGKTTRGVTDSARVPVAIDGTLTVKHVDEDGTDLLTPVSTTKKVGTTYNETKKDIYGYTFISDTGNTSGTYTEENILVVFTYEKNAGDATSEVVKTGPENINSVNGTFEYTITYNGEITDYVGEATLTIVDELPYEIDEEKSSFDEKFCVYDAEANTITCTKEYDIAEDNTEVTASFDLSLVFKSVDSDRVINQVNSNLTYGGSETTADDETETKVLKGKVIATYKDTSGNVLATEEQSEDLAGKDYTTSAKTIYGYTLKAEPTNKNGQYKANETIYVNYVYDKNDGTVTENVTTKTQINTILGANSAFKYVLEYNGEIEDYTGDATITLTDVLPYDVKTIEYDEDACSFNTDTRTLTCSKTVTINERNQAINARFEIVVTYNNLTSTADLSIRNIVNTILTYGDNEEDSSDDVTDTVNASSVVAIYVDEADNTLAESVTSTGLIDTAYTTNEKTIYGYTLKAMPSNKDGVYTKEPITVKYVYTKNDGDATSEVEKTGPENISSVNGTFRYTLTYNGEITDYVGEATLTIIDELPYEIDEEKSSFDEKFCVYDKDAKTITCIKEYDIDEDNTEISASFDLSLVFKNIDSDKVVNQVSSNLTYGDNETTDEDETETEVFKGTVIATYKDTSGNVLAPEESSQDLAGEDYTTSAKTIYGYTLKAEPTNKTGKYVANETIYVNYIYNKNDGTVTENEVEKTGPENINSVNGTFRYTLTYNGEITDYVGEAILTIIDELPYEIDEEKSSFDEKFCVYDKDAKTITCIKEYDIDEDNTEISASFDLSLVFKNIDSDKVVNQVSSNLTYGDNETTDEDETETEVFKGTVIATYKDTSGNVLAPEESSQDLAGEDYTTSAKTIYGYTLKTPEPTNKTGKYVANETIYVNYVYDKNDGTVTENVTTKTQINTILGANSAFKYVLEYNGEIEDYTGDATITLTDVLPYDVKNIEYDEDACSFNTDTRTLTCSKTVTINERNQAISAKFEIVVTYNNLTSTTDLSIKNIVDAILTYGDNEEDSTDDVTDIVNASSVVAIYVDEEDNTLADSVTSTGLIDTAYTTNEKTIYGYTLKAMPTNKDGIYTKEPITVKYVYTKNVGSSEETLTKQGLREVASVDAPFEYTITYETTIKDYVGKVNILIIDELPYEIDTEKSTFGDVCKYENGLLVCEYEETIENANDSYIKIEEELVLYFKNITEEMVINKVESVLTYGEEEVVNEDSTGTRVLSGKVIANYVTDNGEVLATKEEMTGLVGTEYQTNKKAFDKYYLKEVIGEEKGLYASEDIEVTYVYSLIPLPPQTGFEGNNINYLGLIISVLCLLIWKRKF